MSSAPSSPLRRILWAKGRIAAHTLASVREESKLKVAFVSISAVVLLIGIFAGARLAFGLLEIFGSELLGGGRLSLGDLVMARLLSTFSLTVFVLLVFSNVLIHYASLFRSHEMPFLVQSPLPIDTLFLGRFYESVSFSSWATAFLGAPILIAYGVESQAPWPFYFALALFYLPFVVIPAAIGAIVCLLLVRFVTRIRHRAWPLLVGAAVVVIGLFFQFRQRFEAPDLSDPSSLRAILDTLGRSQNPFLPSQWLSEGVLALATGEWATAAFSWLLLLVNAAFFLYLATLAAQAWFYDAWSGLLAADEQRPPTSHGGWLGHLERLLAFLPEPFRALTIKDLRMFWRDPSQWSQFLIFFGIMALYLANLDRGRGVSIGGNPLSWQAWGTLLNLGASMLILASLTTRFVYPLISLEGRRVWILGLSPFSMRTVVLQKFWLSVATTSVFTVSLTVLSAVKLELSPLAFGLSVATVIATTLALSGLAVGLGSLYPSFDEENPSRIVSGMGGTLNFLLSMLYVVLATSAMGTVLLWHDLRERLGDGAFPWILGGALAWIAGSTAVACILPLRLGLRHLERLEI